MKRFRLVLYKICDFFTLPMFLLLVLVIFIVWSFTSLLAREKEAQIRLDTFLATAPKAMCVAGYEHEINYSESDGKFYPSKGAIQTEIVNGYVIYKQCNPYNVKR